MKRTTLMAALTGAAVLLAGCSSTSGTAAPASTSSAAATSSSAMSSGAMSSSMAPVSQATSSEAPGSSAAASITEPSSAAPASDAPSSEATMSSEDSSSDTASSADSTPSSASTSKAPTTVGDTSGGLDVASAAWFSEFCGGLQPVADIAKEAGSLGGSDQAAAQKSLVSLYSKIGSSFTATAAKLKPLPPPTFSGGEAFATKVVSALGASGPTFSADAKKLAAINVKKNPGDFTKALSGVAKDLGAASGPLQELNSLKLTPQTQAAYEKLPACAKLKAGATG